MKIQSRSLYMYTAVGRGWHMQRVTARVDLAGEPQNLSFSRSGTIDRA